MGEVVRRSAGVHREDGSELGGPGPTPTRLAPSVLCIDCPACGKALRLDPAAMTRKLWNGFAQGEGEALLDPGLRRAFDEIARGWDARCEPCGTGLRLLYTLEEWGKMSDAFFPAVTELLVLADQAAAPSAGRSRA